ncbi:unnamed protein product [Didymodactylos carnosus]|uniref:CAP-Gly domain-containing protein n=1 Tax=Didymodactylos carnosus TaxID=1234261 RepID=A0A8S2RRX2_9BILA|nr:unnamed protein product [Didymodactylos carnosus]CAF4182578.1 unnamed protein product [Didymodactylos carnosus]
MKIPAVPMILILVKLNARIILKDYKEDLLTSGKVPEIKKNIILKLNNNVELTNDDFKLAELNLKKNDLIFIDSFNRVDDIDDVDELPEKYQMINVCELNKPLRTANTQYLGILRGILELFIGVIFDEPVGDSNGQDGCIRYFDAKRKHASFIRLEYVQIRDNIKQSSGTDNDDIKLD